MAETPFSTSTTKRIWVATLSGPNRLFSVEVELERTIDELAEAIYKRDPSLAPNGSTSLALYKCQEAILIHPRDQLFDRIARARRGGLRRLVESNIIFWSLPQQPEPSDESQVVNTLIDVNNSLAFRTDYLWDKEDGPDCKIMWGRMSGRFCCCPTQG
ncbi:hypothetical protein BDY19DRAFT_993255 [Irpex rosettiformis]|uniref:Uncharacterized protein n=1 Tax=Irpex rosettiformis TaxID=378272 RepID=A0ACB8U5R5_9APHY|nr:hypothetical protein BDY19DRAFT_993255 [Irpex rosettiformis]